MIHNTIARSFDLAKTRGYNKIYVLVDVHDTILKANYIRGNISKEFYPYAKQTLQELSKRKDVCLILFTCSHPEEIEKYLKFFDEMDIHFQYCNENPEVKTGDDKYGNYDRKFFFNVLLDDKAGFSAEWNWEAVLYEFRKHEIL